MERLNNQPRDEVSDVLQSLSVHSVIYCLSELRAPWGFRVEGAQVAKFHLVLDGSCWLELDGYDPALLAAGEFVLLPHGDAHTVRDEPGSPVRGLDRILADNPPGADGRLAYGGGGATTRLLCGGFGLTGPLPDPLRALLPRLLRFDAAVTGFGAWLMPVLEMLQKEADGTEPGAHAIFAKIADVFVAQALRRYLNGSQQAGLLTHAALLDPAVARATELMHSQPARRWTIAELAQEAGLSRTAFCTRFTKVAGEPPVRHLARVRLSIAAGHLATSSASISQIARLAGYDNEASLSKAFKREFGIPPGRYRTRTLTASPASTAT
ncbi:MAG TPA: AraC family transcriptional regulator [Streptosporangiaceae bacterium]